MLVGSVLITTCADEDSEFNTALLHKLFNVDVRLVSLHHHILSNTQVLLETSFVLFKRSECRGREQSNGGWEPVSLSKRVPPTEDFISFKLTCAMCAAWQRFKAVLLEKDWKFGGTLRQSILFLTINFHSVQCRNKSRELKPTVSLSLYSMAVGIEN